MHKEEMLWDSESEFGGLVAHSDAVLPSSDGIRKPVTELRDGCLGSGGVQENWRTATVVLADRSSSKQEAGSYGPINQAVILCVCLKSNRGSTLLRLATKELRGNKSLSVTSRAQ